MSNYYEDLNMCLSPKIGMERIESHSERSTSTLTTCSATSSVHFSEDNGMELSGWSSSSPLSRMSNDESFSSFGCSPFKKLKRSREISDLDLHSTKANSLAEPTTFYDEENQAKRQNVPLLRPVARYSHRKHSQEGLIRPSWSSNRSVTPKTMCATLGIFKPVQAQNIMSDVTARMASRGDPSGRDCQNIEENDNLEGEDDAELASFFQANPDKSGPAVNLEEVSSSDVFHREDTCDPLMCIFNMDL